MESRPERAQSDMAAKTWSSVGSGELLAESVVGREAVAVGAELVVGAVVFRLWPASEPGRAWGAARWALERPRCRPAPRGHGAAGLSGVCWRCTGDGVCVETTCDAVPQQEVPSEGTCLQRRGWGTRGIVWLGARLGSKPRPLRGMRSLSWNRSAPLGRRACCGLTMEDVPHQGCRDRPVRTPQAAPLP